MKNKIFTTTTLCVALIALVIGYGIYGHYYGYLGTATATTFTIADGDVSGFITAMNTAVSGDTINLAANGTYTLTTINNGANGLPVINASITINGNGSTIERSSAFGTPAFRIFYIGNGTLNLNNTTVKNGNVANSGGAFFVNNGNLNLTGSTVKNISSTARGAVYLHGGTITVSSSIIEENTCTGTCSGGGIASDIATANSLTINNSIVRNNVADLAGGGLSGAGMTMTGSAVYGNCVGTSIIAGVCQTNPSDTGNGGGAKIGGNSTISNSSFYSNTATRAGGGIAIENSSTPITLKNLTISGNIANGNGGGINAGTSGSTVSNINAYNLTITDNTGDNDGTDVFDSQTGGGVYFSQFSTSQLNFTFYNSIIAGNHDNSATANKHEDCSGTTNVLTLSSGYNLVGKMNTTSSTHCHFQNTTGDQIGTTGSPINPLLAALADNGGPALPDTTSAKTHALGLLSPAMDTGSPNTPGSGGNSCPTDDERGITRPSDGNADLVLRCDIGAFEYNPADVILQESGGSTNISESGTSDTYTVTLNSRPSANVTITPTPDAQTTILPASLTFTSGTWNTPQTITVSAVDDAVAEGTHTGTVTHAAVSIDPNYNGIAIPNITANIADNDAAGVSIIETGGSTNINENGTTDTYNVVLNTLPTADVTITITPDAQSTAGPSPLTFTTLNWNVPQTVTVSAIDNLVAEGNRLSTITHSSASTDLTYNGIAIQNVTANVTDNDAAGVTVTQSGGSTNVGESGGTDSYDLVLTSQPTASVTLTITSDGPTTVDQTGITFTTLNWNIPQTITVTGVDDLIAEGNHTSNITHSASSVDLTYNGIGISTVVAQVTDNDTAGVNITQSGGSTSLSEGGSPDDYTVALNSEPTADVTVTISPDAQLSVSPTTLTFTTLNWNTAQTVTANAIDDTVVEGSHNGTITHAATSIDTTYDGIVISSVTAGINDNDVVNTAGSSGGSGPVLTETQESANPPSGATTNASTQEPESAPEPGTQEQLRGAAEEKQNLSCTYKKDQQITRVQMACIVLEKLYGESTPFEFIFSGEKIKISREDLLLAQQTGRYKIPGAHKMVSRVEALEIMLKGRELNAGPLTINYSDVKPSDWFYRYVAYAVNNNIMAGYTETAVKEGKVSKYYRFPRTLGKGNTGDDVQKLKELMTELGYYRQQINDIYDNDLAAAIRNFQKDHHLKPVGQMGRYTRAALLRQTFAPYKKNLFKPFSPVTGREIDKLLAKGV